ncbi:alkaline phosphatase [Sphingomonas baiyangensis]|uniref:Alkaline phosphatase n=1 Tax=Sphingomonas baiyangensis TaxID=2572576 RepID=A0A4U1L2B6_9SPHN|nr:alkaline phosphatase [Sphingomonas baiyangensis]TKD50166.1 alkaline phosphatase [Sphingomonas baiyangensis]
MLVRSVAALALLTLATPAAAQQADTAAYRAQAAAELARLKAVTPVDARARNVILFVGDGFGVSTITAARIHQGQRAGKDGESFVTAMDALPYSALVKTYSHDAQVADSAPTATALLGGVKTRNGSIGVGPEALPDDCASARRATLPSLFALAQQQRRATGVISTARITHATPAATYAHTPQRDWEASVPAERRAAGCIDIARQLIEGTVGSRLDLVLGGGRRYFLPAAATDREYPQVKGLRDDGRDLIAEWRRRHPRGSYVSDAAGFAALDPARATKVLGLFQPDHMQYEADRAGDKAGEPSLAEMTTKAIAMLSRNREGFVLLVEAGRIDHAHHARNARRALEDAIAMDAAVAAAVAATDPADTLIVTTADHGHAFTMAGYPGRGNPVLGVVRNEAGAPVKARDGKGYTTLGYANGLGAASGSERSDPAAEDTAALDYRQQALVPLGGETHGGDDVAVRASGPMAHLLRGTIEQHSIHAVMVEALTRDQAGTGKSTETTVPRPPSPAE